MSAASLDEHPTPVEARPAPPDGSRLLLRELRPERRAIVLLGVILVGAVGLPVIGQLLLLRFVDDAADGADTAHLVRVALGFGAVLVIAHGLRLVVTALAVRLAWRIGNRLRVDLCRHALDLEHSWHSEHSAGEVIERVDGDIEAVTKFSSTAVLEVVGNLAVLILVGATAIVIEWRAGVVLLLTVGVAASVLVRVRSLAVPHHDAEREVLAHLYGDLEERLGGLEDLRANGGGPWAVDRLHRHSARWWRTARQASLRSEGGYATTGITFAIGTALTLGIAAHLAREGQITVGTVLVLFRFVQMVRSPLESIGEQLSQFQKATAGIRRAARLLGTPLGIVPGDDDLPPGALAVDLDHVTLRYGAEHTADAEGDTHVALRDVDLHLAAGTSLGIVGRTGSGKTSLGRLLARFWDPSEGTVRVGGIDLRTVGAASLRARIAVVPQEVEVLRATVRDNVTFLGTLDADDAEVRAALSSVGLGAWLARLPDGLDTVIDGSADLSGGESQLLAFARVLLLDPGLVVLDEATSRLDPVTEARVAAATDALRRGRTLVVIAHRLSTLDDLDEVAVIDAGRVVEHGPRAALAQDPASRFGRLLAAQAAGSVDGAPEAGGDPMTRQPPRRRRPRIGPGLRLGWAIMRQDPVAWLIALGLWLLFHATPLITGWALGRVLNSITDGADASSTWAAIALLAGLEVVRWSMFLVAVVQWHGGWVAWHTRPRMALLDSLVSDPGPATGRLPGSPGEAVSRFRDDAQDVALVLDVWLDVIAIAITSLIAVIVLATIDGRVAVTVAAPAVIVMVITHSMGPSLRRWRRAAREATAGVTGFVGDAFGAIGAVKALGAEGSVLGRFDALGHARAREAARDEVGTQLLDSLSRSTADIGLAAALVVAAPVVASGDMSVGDLGVIAAYSSLLAGLPRFMGRLGAYHRQADVSAERLARMLPERTRTLDAVAGDAELHLRAPQDLPADAAVGPVPGRDDPDLLPRDERDAVSRHPAHAGGPPQGLEVRGLTVVHPGGEALRDVDLTVPPGSVVAVTGPVGGGKSSLLRAVLGLIPSDGSIRWDGEDARENARLMVPPRVAYVPQVPRLFSEPLADAVLLGLPQERLDTALHLACMEEDVAAMPQGVATVVGSRGVRLSGGQVQRVAAARALARRPALLVVDDLSSALDAATEASLWDRILTAVDLDGTAVLVVTHRPAVLTRAQEVVHLAAGQRV